MAKKKGKTDLAEIADERINDELNFDEINDEESYKRAVKNFLRKGKAGDPVKDRGLNLIKFIDENPTKAKEMYEKSGAMAIVESRLSKIKEESERSRILRQAQRFEARRPRRVALRDELRTARRIQPVSRVGLRRWTSAPNRSDFRNIDTRVVRRIALRNQITGQDIRLRNFRVIINKQGVKQYKDLSGRFTRTPYKRFRR